MKTIYILIIILLITGPVFSQGTSCGDAVKVPTDTVINNVLTGSQQHYYYINESSYDTVMVMIQSDTDCGVGVENLGFSTSQTGTCVGIGTANQIISNVTASCTGDSIVYFAIPANELSYFRIYRNFAPAPENYTLTIQSYNLTTGITALKNEKEISIFPNPSTNLFSLKNFEGKWQIFDTLGKQLLSGSSKSINLSHLPTAVYVLKTDNGQSFKLFKK